MFHALLIPGAVQEAGAFLDFALRSGDPSYLSLALEASEGEVEGAEARAAVAAEVGRLGRLTGRLRAPPKGSVLAHCEVFEGFNVVHEFRVNQSGRLTIKSACAVCGLPSFTPQIDPDAPLTLANFSRLMSKIAPFLPDSCLTHKTLFDAIERSSSHAWGTPGAEASFSIIVHENPQLSSAHFLGKRNSSPKASTAAQALRALSPSPVHFRVPRRRRRGGTRRVLARAGRQG